jgi:hypothetical protein
LTRPLSPSSVNYVLAPPILWAFDNRSRPSYPKLLSLEPFELPFSFLNTFQKPAGVETIVIWLINTDDYSLHEFQNAGEDSPYAILSHTWDESEDDPLKREVTFPDMHNLLEAKRKTGWAKIERTCELCKAHELRLRWAWIDTCCIDKSSSAELTEAINSMFTW